MASRRIGYYTLSLSQNDNGHTVEEVLFSILAYIDRLATTDRKQDMGDERFCFLFSKNNNLQTHMSQVIFKSARHSYRAPLIHRDTLNERDNPKLMEEGELYRTHMVIKQGNDESPVVLEIGQNTLTMKSIVEYLNHYLRQYDVENPQNQLLAQLEYGIIPSDSFDQSLRQMTRVKAATVTFHKNILGSDELGFNEQMNDIQESVEVVVKAQRGRSIQDHILSALARLNGGQSQITKIRVKGVLDGMESIIDTDVVVKKSFIDVERSEVTGEYNSPDLLLLMQEIAIEL